MIEAEIKKLWHDKSSAVCLTYDDALKTHLSNVVPVLDSLGLNATFYIPGFPSGFRENLII
jgi:peptidoglycan/xylan/chitin deacetylase (PgdA/CDA1 family)